MSFTEQRIIDLIKVKSKYELSATKSPQGGNSYSFVARHKALDRKVFLKAFDVDRQTAEVFREARLLLEATRGAGPGIRHLVTVLDAELLSEDYGLLAMEFVDGGDLLGWLRNGPLGQQQALHVAIGILYGVSHLHSSNLVHRDIKPSNILLAKAPGGLVPKLGDFGSVARIDPSVGAVTASKHGILYVPPEGFETPSLYTKSSDIYQVGLVLHELVNGALPVRAADYLDKRALREMRAAGADSLEQLERTDGYEAQKLVDRSIARMAASQLITAQSGPVPYLSRRVKAVIKKATAPEPKARFQTATEFLGRLEEISVPNWSLPNLENKQFRANSWCGFD